MKSLDKLRHEFKYWNIIRDQIDQCIDIMLNLSQSGHPGGSRSKVQFMISTLLSGAMKWDIRNPGKRFGDRFILSAGHANPVVYATLAVFNESLRRMYKKTGDAKYLNPMGDEYTLYWQDLLTLRKRGGLPGHAEMEGKTLFFKANTGPSGHGFPIAAGEAFALKYAGMDSVKVFALEGEGGLTPGVIHETKNSAYGLGLGNFVTLVDWNDFGIDNRTFSSVMNGAPKDWFEPHGWTTAGTNDGENWTEIMKAYSELLENPDSDKPRMLWLKMRKGRGYGKFDAPSHGAPHKRNSKEFWDTKRHFAETYNLDIPHMDSKFNDYDENKIQMADVLTSVMSLFDSEEGLLEYLSDRLIEIGDSVPDSSNSSKVFDKNPLHDNRLFDYKNFPESLYKKPGDMAPNRAAFGNYGSWLNSYCMKHYNRPLFIVSSADLAGSTNIAGFAQGWEDKEGTGMYDRKSNLKGCLIPQGITEFANAGMSVGISSVNFNKNAYEDFNGFFTASSTYGSFSYLKYGPMRLFSQMAQDTQFKLGKTIWVAGHSGPETAEDSRTHFGIFSPGVTQLFPEGQIINLHPWDYNEVPVMIAESLKSDIPIIALHLTRPAVVVPDREKLGIPHYFEAAKGAYILKDYNPGKPKEGVVFIRGTKALDELITILPQLKENGPNVKIIAALSYQLFSMQSESYQKSVVGEREWADSMIITNTALNLMSNWIKHPIIKDYSLSPDWDNRWRSGGTLDEVIDESRLTAEWQIKAINTFASERATRLEKINSTQPK